MRFSNGSATGTEVEGNLIGTDADGEDTLDNGWAGVFIEDAPNNSIGGATADHGNLISGFDYGIVLDNADGTDIFSNLIGTNLDGTAALAGNLWAGIELSLSSGVSIGGVGQGNVIGGFGDGIDLLGSGTTATTIQGNFIGTNSAGTADLGNDYDGVYIEGSSNNTIGGPNPGEGNSIRFNDEAGVYVYSGTGNAIRGNAIDGNSDGGATALGIDLRNLGVTANDTGDADTGANNRQNFPVLTASESSPAATSVTGTLNSTANTSNITIDFYASPSCDPSGHGEGAIYLGSTAVSTDGSGNATISVSTLAGLPNGNALQITATATTASGNTSEFSACVTASYTPGEPSGWDGTANWHYEYDGLDRLTYACDAWDGDSCEGTQWTYTYDGAGNLTRFDKWDGDTIQTIAYVYNGANQIQCIDTNADSSCAGEVNYSYDDYGNLTFDGVTTYEYDAAMRLSSVTVGTEVTEYAYNGDGNRVSQAVDGTLTTYTLDVATPLTMVLAEVSPTETVYYLHGLGLVAESSSVDGLRTFGVDGLGSVRQLTDEDGDVLLAQSFDPYGSPYQNAGADVTTYGWAGEQADANGLIYLRARFYAPGMGRFLNTDPSRLEMNPYLYGAGNPVLHTDPSGLFILDTDAFDAGTIIDDLESDYNVRIKKDFGYEVILTNGPTFIAYAPSLVEYCTSIGGQWYGGAWEIGQLRLVRDAVEKIAVSFGGASSFANAMGRTFINRSEVNEVGGGRPHAIIRGRITLPDDAFAYGSDTMNTYWLVHEFGHRWDWVRFGRLSRGMRDRLEAQRFQSTTCNGMGCTSGVLEPDYLTGYSGSSGSLSNVEDWAEAFASYIMGFTSDGRSFGPTSDPLRYNYVNRAVRGGAS